MTSDMLQQPFIKEEMVVENLLFQLGLICEAQTESIFRSANYRLYILPEPVLLVEPTVGNEYFDYARE